jgi:hypothetical protein
LFTADLRAASDLETYPLDWVIAAADPSLSGELIEHDLGGTMQHAGVL